MVKRLSPSILTELDKVPKLKFLSDCFQYSASGIIFLKKESRAPPVYSTWSTNHPPPPIFSFFLILAFAGGSNPAEP